MWRLMILLALAAPAHAACVTHRVASVPLTLWRNKLLLPVMVNGSAEVMALDTGAGTSVLSEEAAGRLNILHDFDHHADLRGAGGAESALFIGQIDRLGVGEVQFSRMVAPIVRLPERDWNNRPLAGLLGADVLSKFDVDLDIQGGQLALWQESGCDTEPPPWDADAQAVSIELDAGHHIEIPMKVDGVDLSAMLDTGAESLVLTMRAGMRAGATEDALDSDPVIHGTGVNDRPWSGHLHRFGLVRFGAARFERVVAALMPSAHMAQYDALIGSDGLIGMSLLRHMRIWISYRTRSLYVQQAGN
jgi:predicted aspartyl protease